MATGDIGTPQWQISGTPEWQAETDLVHVSGKLQVAPYVFKVDHQLQYFLQYFINFFYFLICFKAIISKKIYRLV